MTTRIPRSSGVGSSCSRSLNQFPSQDQLARVATILVGQIISKKNRSMSKTRGGGGGGQGENGLDFWNAAPPPLLLLSQLLSSPFIYSFGNIKLWLGVPDLIANNTPNEGGFVWGSRPKHWPPSWGGMVTLRRA